jgi:tRNA(fMet)-specific endonuclease VapC
MNQTSRVILDTDTLSLIMRRNQKVLFNAQNYLQTRSNFTFSIITRYEILRGLKAKNASVQLRAFDKFCKANEILPITDEIILKASDIYAGLYQTGNLIGDADILIASTAIIKNCVLATNNERHFSRIKDLQVENWLK